MGDAVTESEGEVEEMVAVVEDKKISGKQLWPTGQKAGLYWDIFLRWGLKLIDGLLGFRT